MIRALLALVLSACCAASASAAAPSSPPSAWIEDDWAGAPARYGAEAARFPSASLAAAVRDSLAEAGWSPVAVAAVGGSHLVVVGDVDSAGEAEFIARELAAQRVAEARAIPLPAGFRSEGQGIDGPFLPPFAPTPDLASLPSPAEALRLAREAQFQIPIGRRIEYGSLVARLEAARGGAAMGAPAVRAARILVEEGVALDAALVLAGQAARGEWPTTQRDRIDAREIVAEILHAHLRDWRGAWSATRALRADRGRSPEGRMLDEMRRAALLAELAGAAGPARPSFNEVRAVLRGAWDLPAEDPRLRAQLEVFYLQTFAWQGQWARVEAIGREFVERSVEFPHENALGRILVARSLERFGAHDEALAMLRAVVDQEFPEGVRGIARAGRERDLHGEARRWVQHFEQMKAREAADALGGEEPARGQEAPVDAEADAEEDEAS